MITVLLVEDNELNRDMLRRRLIKRGYGVIEAVTGEQGLEMARQQQPDIVLMDVSLPVMDGLEATRRLRSDPQTRLLPVIALTAHAMAGDAEKSIAAGCDDHDTKPVEMERLITKMRRLLGRAQAREDENGNGRNESICQS